MQFRTNLSENLKGGYDPAMSIPFIALGTAFAAFCVWLTVRIINRHDRWAKLTLAGLVGLPVLYAASFGPVCWILSWTNNHSIRVETAYAPIILTWNREPFRISEAFFWYARLWAADDWEWRSYPRTGGFDNPDVVWIWTDNMP